MASSEIEVIQSVDLKDTEAHSASEETQSAAGFWARASQWAEALTTNGDFEAFIMVIIAGTIITLALDDPLKGEMEGINGTLYWLSKLLDASVHTSYTAT